MRLFKLHENYADMDIDELHLVNNEIKKFMVQLKQDLKDIFDAEDLLG